MENMWQELLNVLEFIGKKLHENDVNWVLVGSLSLALQGVDIVPKDIDILTDEKGAFLCNELFKEYCVKPVEWSRTEEFASYFGIFQINDIPVEVMGELEVREGATWRTVTSRLKKPRYVKVKKITIPVSSLKDQLEAYKKLAREKDKIRVTLIEEALRRLG